MKIKIKNIIILSAFVAIFATACEDFLDIPPEDPTLEEALQNENDLFYLQNSTYTVLGSGSFLGGRIQVVNELLSENLEGGSLDGDWAAIYDRSTSIFENIKNAMYEEAYRSVYRANTVLEHLDLATTRKDNIEGQARFVRAVAHFELVRVFAQPYGYFADNSHPGIPIKTEAVPSAAQRATVKQVYDFIIDELKTAEAKLPSENDGYPTKWSAKAYLAKVYFQMNDFTNAFAYANDVIENGTVKFNTDTTEYTQRYAKEGSTEAVFSIISKSLNVAGEVTYINRGGDFGNFRCDGDNDPYMKLSKKMSDLGLGNSKDRRAALYIEKGANYGIGKFNSDNLSVSLVTITELKLIRAESAGELNTNLDIATSDLQDIMTRAYRSGAIAPTVAAYIIAEARLQRQLEFVGEGFSGQDLKRRGAKGENIIVRDAPWNCPGAVIQFPSSEIGNNPGFERNPERGC